MIHKLQHHTFLLFTLCSVSTLIAAPSKEVTDQLIAELQNMRNTLAHNAIELFEEKDNAPHISWEEALCRNIISEDKPCTQLPILTNDIQKILYCTHNINDVTTYKDKNGAIRIGARIDYTYAERAERFVRLDSYINSFVSKAIAYVKEIEVSEHESSPTCAIVIHDYALKLIIHSMENGYQANQTRTITPYFLTTLEARLLGSICLFSNFLNAHLPQKNSTYTARESAAALESRKRIHSDESQANNATITNTKRLRAENETSNSDDYAKTAQSIAPTISKKPKLQALLRSQSYGTNTICKRSNIMAHEGFRNHFLKMESQAIARTMIDQAEKLSMLNGIIWANTENEQDFLAKLHSQLQAYQKEKPEILHSPEIKESASFMIETAQKISANVSDLEANHVKKYDQNVARIKQWQGHYQNALNMGLIYLKFIALKDPDHIKQCNTLINRFTRNVNTDVIPTLPQENLASAEIQKALDLQRITLANKTTRTLAGILRIQKMIQAESGDQSDINDDDDGDDSDNNNADHSQE